MAFILERKLPPPTEQEFKFDNWTIKTVASHIMGSQCEKNNSCKVDTPKEQLCHYCLFDCTLQLPSTPDMVYANNILRLTHESGASISFTALEALMLVNNHGESVQVAHSTVWQEARSSCEYAKKIHKQYDWTYTTDYRGTLEGGISVEETSERIDLDKLRQKEEIKFFEEVYLYEDELDDNGCSRCIVKVRVMPSGFFVVLRHYLRVDHVMIRVNDTRLYHPIGTNHILRESSTREEKISNLKVGHDVYTEPDLIWQHLKLVKETVDKLVIKQSE